MQDFFGARDRDRPSTGSRDVSIVHASGGAGISWLHRNAEVLNKQFYDGRFARIVRVDETKRDVVMSRFDAVPHAM